MTASSKFPNPLSSSSHSLGPLEAPRKALIASAMRAEVPRELQGMCTMRRARSQFRKRHLSRSTPVPQASWLLEQSEWSNLGAQAAIFSTVVALAETVKQRPVGWARTELVEVRESPIAGLGLFARTDIPKGTTIGRYPGRVVSPAFADAKLEVVPHALEYLYGSQDQFCLDPTDQRGIPSPFFAAFQLPPWPFPVKNHIIRINEPTRGVGGTNVDLIEHSNGKIWAVTVRDIPAGQELFTDYGVFSTLSHFTASSERSTYECPYASCFVLSFFRALLRPQPLQEHQEKMTSMIA